MLLKHKEKIIRSVTRRKNLFVLDTQIDKVTLVKESDRPIYLLSKNTQIRLWHRQLEHASNIKVVKASRLTDNLDIIIEESQQNDSFSLDSKNDRKVKNLEIDVISDNNYPPVYISTLLNQVINSNNIVK